MNTRSFKADALIVKVLRDRSELSVVAGEEVATAINKAIKARGSARIILASAPSQDGLLTVLTSPRSGIPWELVTVFHLEEYVGVPADHTQSFRSYLTRKFLARVKPAAFHGIRGELADAYAEVIRYERLLADAPIDVVCCGMGENGRLAFNDPQTADFNDAADVKIVQLEESDRAQQVHDKRFARIEEVPHQAITLTLPRLMKCESLFCVVPGPLKADAVKECIEGRVAPHHPASIMRRHPAATLFLDEDSAQLLKSVKRNLKAA